MFIYFISDNFNILYVRIWCLFGRRALSINAWGLFRLLNTLFYYVPPLVCVAEIGVSPTHSFANPNTPLLTSTHPALTEFYLYTLTLTHTHTRIYAQ